MRSFLIRLLLLGAFVAAVAAGVLAWKYQEFLDTPLSLGEAGMQLEVSRGSGLRQLADGLAVRGAIEAPDLLVLHARLEGLDTGIKAGEYFLPPGTTPPQLLELLTRGQVVLHALTLVEGWTFDQMMQAVTADERLLHTLEATDPDSVMAAIGHPGEHPEGRFFPDTYHFPRGIRDVDFLRRAYDMMQEVLADVWARRADDLPLKEPYEALTLASIIERESGLDAERAEISGVFTRRLRIDMRLQTDPTVIYGLGDAFDGNLRRRDLRTDTPYNTYTRKGLPPTPIAMPGRASLEAAVHPADGKSLYFVARKDGSHVFSETLEAHNAAVRKYQLNGGN